jgi:hypothetical protein
MILSLYIPASVLMKMKKDFVNLKLLIHQEEIIEFMFEVLMKI